MKELYYKKVFIKTEADLPKEEGRYITHTKGYESYYVISVKYEHSDNYFWMQLYDWYLQPTEVYEKDFLEWIVSEESPVVIWYGSKKPFATKKKDYTIDELYEYYLKKVKGK